MKSNLVLVAVLILLSGHSAHSAESEVGELHPFEPGINEELEYNDFLFGASSAVSLSKELPDFQGLTCSRASCAVWANISIAKQTITIMINGEVKGKWPVSTGAVGRDTPNFDKHPDGRIYDAYTSSQYPEGDYKGLGNMPYSVFISGGFAIHGTPEANWFKLGHQTSHGCVRLHPDVAYFFNRAVRKVGVSNTWITVQ